MDNWHITSFLPEQEPCLNNLNTYLSPSLISGSSNDARFVFDAVYRVEDERFVLTLMQVDDEFGIIEHEVRLHPTSRAELLAQIERFCHAPQHVFAVEEFRINAFKR